MKRLRSSIIALAVLMILVGALTAVKPFIGLGQVTPGPAKPPPSFGRPGNFYLTRSQYNGAQALSACAAGYHMASIWEIHDPSALRYNTALGLTDTYSGLGPPSSGGWIRTGEESKDGNCFAWTSADGSVGGSLAYLPAVVFDSELRALSPWVMGGDKCNSKRGVWCVKD